MYIDVNNYKCMHICTYVGMYITGDLSRTLTDVLRHFYRIDLSMENSDK